MILRKQCFAGIVIVLAVAAMCQADFQVNTHINNDQKDPAIAMDAEGNFVIVWQSMYQDGDSGGIYGQRFTSDGVRIGNEFLVNTTTSENQKVPDVAMDAAGNFIVVWEGPGDGNLNGIYARRYAANGQPLTGEFLVNSYTDSSQDDPSVAMNSDGKFVIVWESYYHPTHQWYTRGQLYNSLGTVVGGEFIISQESGGFPPDVAMDDLGDFVVVFERNPGYYIYMRRYNANGTAKGPAVDVSGNLESRGSPSIGMAGSGNFVVAWSWDPEPGWSNSNIYAKRYDSSGNAIGSAFVVNTYTDGQQGRLHVTMNNYGQFVVVWYSSNDHDGDGEGVFGQRYDINGIPVGDEFQVNSYVIGSQWFPQVAMKNNGEFITVWQSDGQDGDDYGIFDEFGPKICCADFSGDLYVNFQDFCVLAREWLHEGDLLETDLIDDDIIDELDLAVVGGQWLTPCYECSQADIYSDGKIDFKDYSLFAGNWQGQGPLVGDITGNGTVDADDLKVLVFHWLE